MSKPKLSNQDLIIHMKNKGIKFNIISETKAIDFLDNHNYFFKLASYRKNYEKSTLGKSVGKYLNLDFAYLKELSNIDYYLRIIILQLCLDIEHSLKLTIINDISTNTNEDGYNIVNLWDASYYNRARIFNKFKKSYNTEIVKKYHPNYPIWSILELLSFGELCDLIDKYSEVYPGRLNFDSKLLYPVRRLRNACAHNSCLINDLRPQSTNVPDKNLTKELQSISGISATTITKKLRCQFIQDFLCLVLLYPMIVVSKKQRSDSVLKLRKLLNVRILRHEQYFINNNLLSSTYIFIHKVMHSFLKKY